MDKKKSKLIYNPPLIIKISISEIYVLKEEFQNHISEYSLKFIGTNNNKFNIYNLSYILKNPIDLIPIKTPLLNSITIYLMKSDKFISKGILYLNKNTNINEQIVKLKHINIKFNYILNFIDFIKNKNNTSKTNKKKIINKNNSPLKKGISISNPKTEKKEYKNCYNSICKRIKENIFFRNFKSINQNNNINKNNNNYYHNNSCVELGNNLNRNTFFKNENNNNEKEPKIKSYYSTIENKDYNYDKINFSNNWVNNTKLLLKKVDRYLTLRNSKKNSKNKFKKSLSVKNIKLYSIDKHKINKSLTEKIIESYRLQKKYKEYNLENKNNFKYFSDNRNSLITSDEDNFNTISHNNFLFKKYSSLKKLNSSSYGKENRDNQSNLDKTNFISQNSKNSNKKYRDIDDIFLKNKIKLFENNEKNNFQKIDKINEKNFPILINLKKNEETNSENNSKEFINNYKKQIINLTKNDKSNKKDNNNNIIIFNNRYNIDDSLNINNISNDDLNDNKNNILLNNNHSYEKINLVKINSLKSNKYKNIIESYDNSPNIQKVYNIDEKNLEINNNNNNYKQDIINLEYKGLTVNANNEHKYFEHFNRLKEEFYSLYNNNYIHNIKDELLKLEIELLLEKIIELIYEYHFRINEEKTIYNNLFNYYNNYKYKYFIFCKLFKKLKKIKQQKNENLIKKDYIIAKNKNLFISKDEILIFQTLFKNNKKIYNNNYNYQKTDTKIMTKIFKNILIKILNKNNNKDKIINNEKNINWIKNNILDDENYIDDEYFNNNKITKKNIKIKFKIDNINHINN